MGLAQAGQVTPAGTLGLTIIRKDAWLPEHLRQWNPRSELGKYVLSVCRRMPRDIAIELIERISRTLVGESALSGKVFRGARWDAVRKLWDVSEARLIADLGLLSPRKVTTAGVNFLVDALQGITEPEILKFHALGTGATAESNADTALVTELTTAYTPDSTRATGSLTEGAGANVFRTVGTNTMSGTAAAVTEHGIMSQAATGGGTLLDRSVFSVVNLADGDSLQTTYDFTINAEA